MKQAKSKKITRVILDFDNTIASWTDYAVPAYFSMAEALSKASNIELPSIIADMKKVYDKRKTIEYAPLVQEMEIFKNRKDIDELVKAAKTAFSKVKRKHLKLYPGMKSLLEKLKDQKIKIYILTDAPFIQAAKRAERLEISHFIDGLIGLESPSAEKIHPDYRKPHLKFPFKTLVSPVEKPYTNLPEVLSKITDEIITKEELKSNTIMIGDNPLKDGLLMQKWGLSGYLAEYGRSTREIEKQISTFVPLSLAHRSMFVEGEKEEIIEIDPDHNIKKVNSVHEIIEDLEKNDFTIKKN